MTKQELETYLMLHEQKVEGFVRARSRNWLIAFGIAFVLFIVLVVVIFRKTKPVNDAYEGQIQQLDSTIKYQQATIDALQSVNASQDSVIYHLDEAYKKNRPVETRIITKYEKVPIDVHNMDNEQLRREVSNY